MTCRPSRRDDTMGKDCRGVDDRSCVKGEVDLVL